MRGLWTPAQPHSSAVRDTFVGYYVAPYRLGIHIHYRSLIYAHIHEYSSCRSMRHGFIPFSALFLLFLLLLLLLLQLFLPLYIPGE